jgi:hypothetical protein
MIRPRQQEQPEHAPSAQLAGIPAGDAITHHALFPAYLASASGRLLVASAAGSLEAPIVQLPAGESDAAEAATPDRDVVLARPPLAWRDVLVAVQDVVRVVPSLQRLQALERLVAKSGTHTLDRLVRLHVVHVAAADRPWLEGRRRGARPLDGLLRK